MNSIDPSYLPAALLPLIPAFIGVLLFFFVLFTFHPDRQVKVFLAFLACTVAWQLTEALIYLSNDKAFVDKIYKLESLTILLLCALCFEFAVVFTKNKKLLRSRFFYPSLYGLTAVFIALEVLDVIHSGSIFHPQFHWVFEWQHSPAQLLELLWISSLLIGSLLIYYRKHNRLQQVDYKDKVQVLILIGGFGVPILIGIIFQILLPIMFSTTNFSVAAPSILFFNVAVIIALLKYRLFHFNPVYATKEVLEMMNDGVVIIDEQFKIKYANSAFLTLTGHNYKEVLAISLLDFEYIEEDVENDSLEESVYELQSREYALSCKDETPKYVQISYSNYINQHGKEAGVIVLFNDISEQKKMTEKLVYEKKQAQYYQSMLIGSQLNPHFIFNTLNSIQFYILDKEDEDALDYVSDFSKLMRVVLNNSIKTVISLKEEESFLQQYMELELKRFENKFEYTINMDNGLDAEDAFIPPMLIQPYVENSILHGFGGISSGGNIDISFRFLDEKRIQCQITDNGCGRQALSAGEIEEKSNSHLSHGLRLVKTRMKILTEINEAAHFVEIEDVLSGNGQLLGTKVLIHFPLYYE